MTSTAPRRKEIPVRNVKPDACLFVHFDNRKSSEISSSCKIASTSLSLSSSYVRVDGDGLNDTIEKALKLDPYSPDSDGDG